MIPVLLRRFRGCASSFESGTMSPMLGGLVFIVLVVVAVATEVASLHGAFLEVAAVADAAAESGAAQLDRAAAHSGVIQIDPTSARVAGEQLVASVAPGAEAVVSAGPDQVCVEVRTDRPMGVLTVIGVDTFTVSASSCASPASG